MKRSLASREVQWLLEEKYHGQLTSSAKRDIARLQKGEHVDYVIGFVDFLGCRVDLSKKPFIPRPETEHWTRKAIAELRQESYDRRKTDATPISCLDMFAGSGCVGIAILKHVPNAVVDFAEKKKKFCDQIKINAKLNGIDPKRYQVIQSNVFSSIKGEYDYIFANPPYLAESRKSKVQSSVLKHEPREALSAGKDGLDIILPFLNRVKDFLVEGGSVYLEFDSFQKRLIEQYLKRIGYKSLQFFRDQYGKWRFAVIQT